MTGAKNIVEAVGEGIVDLETLRKRSGLTESSFSATISKLVLSGCLVADKKNKRQYDWTTLRPAGTAPKRGNSPRSAPKQSRATRAAAPSPESATPPPSGDGLEDCTSVTYQPEEIVALVELEATLTIAVAKVREVVNALQASPKLGPKGAAAMRLIATLMAETK